MTTCIADTCDREVKAHGYCQSHAQRMSNFGHPDGPDATLDALRSLRLQRLSVAPLQELCDKRGGIRSIIDQDLPYQEVEMFETRIRRALARGWIAVDQADELAMRALKTLPQDIWDDWFTTDATIAPPSFDIDDHLNYAGANDDPELYV